MKYKRCNDTMLPNLSGISRCTPTVYASNDPRLTHVLNIGTGSAESGSSSKKRKDTAPEAFDFEKSTTHEIFTLPNTLSGPDANTVVADDQAIRDLKGIIDVLYNEVMTEYKIEIKQQYRGLFETPIWNIPEGSEKFKARMDDMKAFQLQLNEPRTPVAMWSTFRMLVSKFMDIAATRVVSQKTRFALDMAAISSGFFPGADGSYYFDQTKTKGYRIYGALGLPSSYPQLTDDEIKALTR